ncbi:class I SAM-dependent methyltransferase [Porticoccus sp. W117]|uniref:SAM-dependent methyltransferase n=1 Tax=Porticoccus sp. W117 TaxID=3054777 RepID=UPI002599D68E|nr:class I SAM-dependent methyltransferase [Porticoccus sp. W117]MDM3871905.1 class I SAM-dependent methyltransferase [Porticoccus sp. W117]
MNKITTPNWDKNSWISSPEYVDCTVKFLTSCLQLKPTSKVLDIGCGRGNISAALSRFNNFYAPVEAVDITDLGGEVTERDQLDFHLCDGVGYLKTKPDCYYNGIILKQVFHLIPEQDRQKLLAQIFRCLKKEGCALILQMPAHSEVPMFTKLKDVFYRELLPLNSVIQMAESTGLKVAVSECRFSVGMAKQDYFRLLEQRFMSVLREFSDWEIEDGITELDGLYPQETLEFTDALDVIQLSRQ